MRRVAVLSSLCLLVSVIASTGGLSVSTKQSARMELHPGASGCSNNPGPTVTLEGELSLGGVGARLILTNNRRFTHVTSEDITIDVSILDAGESIQLPKQPVLGGVGGNPFIWVALNNCDGGDVGEPQFLGRCVQGLDGMAADFELPTGLDLEVVGGSCRNNPGPFITLEGEMSVGGICGTLIFTNNRKFTHVTAEDVTAKLILLPPGEILTFSKSPAAGGAGGNPFIWVQLLDGDGEDVGGPIFVGRCKDL